MCGIAGIWNRSLPVESSKDVVRGMCSAMVHRGPDGEGYYFDGGVGLGHRRLNIIDLEGGRQPLGNEDGKVWVVFNGEIYNFQEIRGKLLQKGHLFKTRSDTEVIVHAYEEYGEECLQHFRGMFAFAIWDSARQRVFIARDRVGKKPLYYYLDEDRLIFASELKAILTVPGISREVDPVALNDYLSLGYIPSPRSIFKNIKKLPPAHSLLVNKNGSQTKRYWELRFEPDLSRSEEELIDEFRSIFLDATRTRLISDVPLGAFLSGGVDSSSVVALMQEAGQRPLITNAIGFDVDLYDELDHAREVADRFQTIHHEFRVKAPSVLDRIERIIQYFDEPFADSSAIPTFLVSELTRSNVTVALSGDGGDENLAGYRRYLVDSLENKWRGRLPFLQLPARLLGIIYPQSLSIPQIFRGKTFLNNFGHDPVWAFWNSETLLKNGLRDRVLDKDFKRSLNNGSSLDLFRSYYAHVTAPDHLSKIQALDIRYYLCEDILTKVDQMSMANSLETRAPLLDHKLMEFLATVPSAMKLRGKQGKYLLKKAMAPYFRPGFLDRKKQGFSMPISEWFRGPLRSTLEERVLRSQGLIRQCFDSPQLQILWGQHQAKTRDHSAFFWSLLALQIWEDRYLH